MTLYRNSTLQFSAFDQQRAVDNYGRRMIVRPRTIGNALKQFATLLCVFCPMLAGVVYGQTTDKPGVVFALDVGANGQRKTPSAPMERLIAALAGEWSTEIIYEPSEQIPQGGSGRSRDSYRVGPARSSVIEEYHAKGAGGKSWGTGLFWWDERAHGFRFVWCDSYAIDAGCRVSSDLGTWNGDTFVIIDSHEVSGKTVFEKEVWSSFTADSFNQTLYVGDSRDNLKLYMTIKAKRVIQQSLSQSITK